MTVRNVDLFNRTGESVSCAIHHSEVPPWRMIAECVLWGSWSFEQPDLYECTLRLRERIEPLGWLLRCNCSCLNAFVSGMARDMSGAQRIELFPFDRDLAATPRIVELFDPAPVHQIGTIEEQEAWLREFWAAFDGRK